MRYALPVSILLHVLLLLLLNGGGAGNSHKGDSKKSAGKIAAVKVKLLDKPVEKPKPKLQVKQKTKTKVAKKQKLLPPPELVIVNHKCEQFYYGVGYMNDGQGSCKVVSVPKGYPADRAGLRVGDLVMNPMGGECPGRGAKGTTLTIVVLRGTQVITMTMVREKVCTSKEEK